MIYFTSDLHIGHDKEFIWKARGFNSIKEHDAAILENWNNVIDYKDTVYILGDLCLGGDEEEWDNIFYSLHGHKYFILGNHDTTSRVGRYESLYGMYNLGYANMYRYSKKKNFYLSHYPTMMGNMNEDRFLWNISGHTHSKNPFQYGEYKIYNVAIDAHNNTPVSIETIVKEIERYSHLK